nr:hypothetical protein GCM10020093_062690 [Planobispora longispora]
MILENKVFISQLDQLGARNGVTAAPSEIEALIGQALQQQQGMTLDQLALTATVPPSELNAFVRANVIHQKLMSKFGAGQDEASQQAASQKLAEEAVKVVPVTRNPATASPARRAASSRAAASARCRRRRSNHAARGVAVTVPPEASR